MIHNINKAFTLIEVLVALSVFMIIALIATAVLHHSILIQSEINETKHKLNMHEVVISQLKNQISKAVDYINFGQDLSFDGQQHKITFNKITNEVHHGQLEGFVDQVTIFQKGNKLIEQSTLGGTRTLGSNVSHFFIQYQSCQGVKKTQWQSYINNTEHNRDLPCLVKINMVQAGDSLKIVIPIKGGNLE